jgi:hypothetical protein
MYRCAVAGRRERDVMKIGSKFKMGFIVATPAALEAFTRKEIIGAIERHVAGDWGDLDPEDVQTNNAALKDGDRLLSSYEIKGKKLWVITEGEDDRGERSATTVLLPEDY